MSKNSEPASEMATAASPAAAAAWVRASQVNGGTTSRREKSRGIPVVRSCETGSHEAGDVTPPSYGSGPGSLVPVAQSPDGDDASGVGGIGLDLAAQALDVDVEGLRVADVVRSPDAIDE